MISNEPQRKSEGKGFLTNYAIGLFSLTLSCLCGGKKVIKCLFFFWYSDEYRIKPVEEVKYMKNGAEEEQKIAARNQENLVRIEFLV